ncbi:MAG: cytochrome C554 [Candidatus Aminicenantes bacterium]|nr:cytochrome C554 [Candidatus Aminicenantes bacterium]
MKKVVLLAVLVASIVLMLLLSQEFTYVGAAKCQICHKTESQGLQYPIWQKSQHSVSLAALSSPDATAIAQAAGVQNPAENPACLKCHSPLFEKAPELKAEGVTCEVCHGPGSEYRKLSIMKDRALAVKNGLIVYDSQDAIKKQCLTCHENAHGKSFDFAAAYEKIKHPKPEAK